MLFPREYAPAENEILYHYCSPSTFFAIVNGKQLRFSDLFSMNDFMEIHWGYLVWEQAATDLIDIVGKDFLDEIDLIIHSSSLKCLALASCFSRDGDVLSQWRSYAQDGIGYAIGFNAQLLTELAVQPLQIEYDFVKQVSEVKTFVLALYEVENKEKLPRSKDFSYTCASLAFDLAAFKNPAFQEENEVRLLHIINFQTSNDSLRLADPGGTAFKKNASPQPVKFQMRGSTPAPYLDLDFTNSGNVNPIYEVVLGPKNDAMSSGVSVFLETVGIPNVKIRRSRASYR